MVLVPDRVSCKFFPPILAEHLQSFPELVPGAFGGQKVRAAVVPKVMLPVEPQTKPFANCATQSTKPALVA